MSLKSLPEGISDNSDTYHQSFNMSEFKSKSGDLVQIKIDGKLNIFDLPGFDEIFIKILKYLDFRDLLSLKISSDNFSPIVNYEIMKRNKSLLDGFYSDKNFWYVGRRCNGLKTVIQKKDWDYIEVFTLECKKWCEITEITSGRMSICKRCRNAYRNAIAKYNLKYSEFLEERRIHRKVKGETYIKFISKNE